MVERSPYTLTLVSVDNDDGDIFGDIASTLEVVVNDAVNGTSIICEIFRSQKTLFLFQTGLELLSIHHRHNKQQEGIMASHLGT